MIAKYHIWRIWHIFRAYLGALNFEKIIPNVLFKLPIVHVQQVKADESVSGRDNFFIASFGIRGLIGNNRPKYTRLNFILAPRSRRLGLVSLVMIKGTWNLHFPPNGAL